MSIPRAKPGAVAFAAAAAMAAAFGCGGSGEKSDEDRAADVAKQYVASNANSEDAKCLETLAEGVDKKLCGDLAPLATRINPETKKASVKGSAATVTVTGAGNNTRIDVTLVKQGGEWRVQRWRGYAVPPNS